MNETDKRRAILGGMLGAGLLFMCMIIFGAAKVLGFHGDALIFVDIIGGLLYIGAFGVIIRFAVFPLMLARTNNNKSFSIVLCSALFLITIFSMVYPFLIDIGIIQAST
jgi:hypothetical protein